MLGEVALAITPIQEDFIIIISKYLLHLMPSVSRTLLLTVVLARVLFNRALAIRKHVCLGRRFFLLVVDHYLLN